MNIIFKKIIYSNIQQIGNKAIEIDLDQYKKTLIIGQNGSGKSTLLEAITFALFGVPFRTVTKGSIVNRINKKKLLVELYFSAGTDEYYIKRGIKPNILEIHRNGQAIDEASSIKDFQKWFELNCLKMNIQTFKQIILIGTAGYVPFMQLSTPARRPIVEDMCDISIFSKMDSLNKSVIKNIKLEMSEIDIKISSKINEVNAYTLLVQEQQSNNDNIKNDITKEINDLTSEISTIKNTISNYKDNLINIQTNMIKNPSESINKCNNVINLAKSKIVDFNKTINFFDTNDTCPTCTQPINIDFKNDIILRNNTEIDSVKEKLQIVTDKLTEYKEQYSDYEIKVAECTQVSSNININNVMLMEKQRALDALNAKLSKLDNKPNIDTTKIDSLSIEITNLKERKNILFKEQYNRMIILGMLKDTGIKAKIIKKYIPIINSYINKYLKLLGADYVFTLDEEFNEKILGTNWDKMSYNNFSEGEKARINIAIMFTWKKITSIVSGININLLILDEVFDSSADTEGVKEIRNLIDELDSNTIIISHRESNDQNDFDKTIKMIKQGRFSIMQ